MRWLKAFIAAVILSVIIIFAALLFSVFMQRQIEIWMNVNYALGFLPRLLISLYSLIRKYIFFWVPLVIAISFAGSFIAAGLKQDKGA